MREQFSGMNPTLALMRMTSDSRRAFRQDAPSISRGIRHFMPSIKQARWPEAILTTIALWLFVLLIFLPIIVERHSGEAWTSVALDSATVIVSMLFAMPMFAVFRSTLRWPQGKRTMILIATVIATAIANTIFDLVFQKLVATHVESAWASLPRDLGRAYPSALNYTLVFGVNMALFQVNYARRTSIIQELQLSQARSSAQQAQLAALRYQLNPHFLFNALNSISALIVTKRNEDAERMTEKLSSFLRSSLNADPGELIPLDEELAITEEYLGIESVRFGARLNVNVDCAPDACEALVPSFLVQPLVENAIKHGVGPSREPVDININASIDEGSLCITVENGVAPGAMEGQAQAERRGVGLRNVRRRLEAVYGTAATLTTEPLENRYVATICIPEIQRTS